MKRLTLNELRGMLIHAECRAVNETDFIARSSARDDVRRIKARINRRERDDAMRSIGMVKVRGNLGGTYWE